MNKNRSDAHNEDIYYTLSDQKASAVDESQADTNTEVNGPRGLEPTRYGDWEKQGRCIDF